MALFCALLALAVGLGGCPTFEGTYSGTYRQTVDSDRMSSGEELIAVDFFRYGSAAKAVVRYYKPLLSSSQESPFHPRNQTRCVWTQADQFLEESGRFSLPILPSARRTRATVEGYVDELGRMEITIVEEGAVDEPEVLELEQLDEEADGGCETISDFLIIPDFNSEKNTFPREVYELRNPVFAITWVNVEPVERDGVILYVPLTRPEPAIRLDGHHFDADRNGLKGNRPMLVPPPAERRLVTSGTTRYALAHFVVIDDRPGEGNFSWEVSEEPIVAASLQRGRHPDAPDNVETNGWGKALLFVEGKLSDLDVTLRRRIDRFDELDPEFDNRHFYIVDVFFYNEEVLRLRLLDDILRRNVPVQLTETYLSTNEILLPRLFPYN